MPAALAVDRELIKQLVLEGFTPNQVEEKTGVPAKLVRNWKSRYKWSEEIQRAANGDNLPQAERLKRVADRLGELAVKECDRVLEALAAMGKPKSRGDCKTHAQAVLTALSAGRKAIGVEGDGGPQHLHLHMMLKPEALPQSPAIDIEAQSI